ncbi:uncharacterized protein At5g08430 isoform X2 [Herrania umbratica]|uniref:Uncharacterized protein At5g08430 isoform X2 n=1 Tax=Herrania umbratica TaxID=108875 RepID=A0A6J1A8J9_9ROSI|nr:uncharacterized protein At5g08430 isoform X2 [Herrania umbratica]
MSKNKGKKKVKAEKEDDAEDWCFVCKDGGKLLLCDFKGCGKAYHPVCVGKKNSVLKSEGRWTCCRHSCSVCGGPPQFYCLCCPDAVCRLCARSAEFVSVKLKKGLCKTCLEVALLAENNAEFNSQGVKMDFEDPDTEEFMFKGYLEIIMEQEDLTFDDLHRAELKKENYYSSSDSDKIEDEDAAVTISDGDSDTDFAVIDNSLGKRKKSEKKQVHKNKIYDLLEAHFVDTLGQSNSDENENDSRSCSGNEDEHIVAVCKKQRTLSTDTVPLEEKVDYAVQKNCYASIVAENIKLVYLRRSLVEELLMQSDNFEDKVVGSFVRVKRMHGNCSIRTSFQLLQVTGIKKTSNAKVDRGILLEVSCMPVDIPIDMLNDGDISEEECEDLRQRMKDGLLRKPTVVELEQKAKSLHEDVTKNWIRRQLVSLQNKIDFAHEKGRRYMLERFLDEREMLKKSSEQQRLLLKLPRVIAEEIEPDPTARDSSENNCSNG